jgi:SPP1 gp7 family putative phage head morphogenesis protein
MTRSQEEIDKFLDDKITKAESQIDKMFARRLKEILAQLSEMYRKYGDKGELSFTDLNRYNRFQKEMKIMAEAINEDYKQLQEDIQELMEYQYIENFLRTAFVLEFAAQTEMGFGVPSLDTIKSAIVNPIDLLTLPNLMESNRREITRRLQMDISQGLLAGEGYSDIAARIEKSVGFGKVKARRVARTEGHRVQTTARMESAKEAAKHANMTKMWMSGLDSRVRTAHRNLDGTVKGIDDIFVSTAGGKGQGPGVMWNASDDCNCRCTIVYLVNGIKPALRRARNEEDPAYQLKLAHRIEKYMNDGLTEKAAEKKAKKEILPPSLVIPYQTYEEWRKKL